MRKIFFLLFLNSLSSLHAQYSPPPPTDLSSTKGYVLGSNNTISRKGSLIEKKTVTIGTFKNLEFQKNVITDFNNTTSYAELAIVLEYETYDTYSRRTVNVDKNELSILIESLKGIEKKSSDVFTDKTRFKFVTQKKLEFGSVYDVLSKKWNHYILFSDRHIIPYNSIDMKDLITLLTKVEKEL